LLKVKKPLLHQTILGMVVHHQKLMMEMLELKVKEKYSIKIKVKMMYYVMIQTNIG